MAKKKILIHEGADDSLTSEAPSPGQIDDFIATIEVMDIEKAESNQKVELVKPNFQKIQAEVKGESEEGLNQATLSNFNDPIRMYLREMSSVSLLNREEEVEIAKRIEEGEEEIAYVVLHSPIIVSEVITLGENLKSDKLSVREIIGIIDNEETDIDEEYYKKQFLSLLGRIKKSEYYIRSLQKKSAQKNLSKQGKKELQKKIDRGTAKIFTLIHQININKIQIDLVAQKLICFFERLERAEGEIIQCTRNTGIPLEELKKLFRQVKKSPHEARKTAKKSGITKKALLAYEQIIKNHTLQICVL